jgi:hypothetical protein
LGDSLQEAADKIGDIARSFTEPLQAGSTALDNDDLLTAGQALEDLAKVIDQIETDPAEVAEYKPLEQDSIPPPDPVELEQDPEAPQQENTQSPVENQLEEDEQPPEEERLGVEGEPLELESDPEQEEDKVVESADPDAEASDEETESTPFTRQPLITPSQELGPDPLIYPWQKREVVRRYFTP